MHVQDPARRPAWLFDRHDRLSALAARARELAHALFRERCDLDRTDTARRAALAARIAVYQHRFRILASCARTARRAHKHAIIGG